MYLNHISDFQLVQITPLTMNLSEIVSNIIHAFLLGIEKKRE